MKPKIFLTCLLSAGLLALAGSAAAEPLERDIIHQPGLLQSLTASYFDGFIPVRDLKKYGDTGIGTFDGVNGEMVLLDGHMYQALGDGSVVEASDKETVPFADVTFFDTEIKEKLADVKDLAALKVILNATVNKNGVNYFYMVKATGTFNSILVRSELKQNHPYRTLAAALAEDQREFTYQNIEGTMVALYCPSYMQGLNTPGWHFHFISADRKKGGHVLAADLQKAVVEFDLTRSFSMVVPSSKRFNELDLGKDQSKDIRKVEQQDRAALNK